jgi:hypothetical protein
MVKVYVAPQYKSSDSRGQRVEQAALREPRFQALPVGTSSFRNTRNVFSSKPTKGGLPEGSLEYQVEGKPPVTLKAGNFFIPARAIHTEKNVGSGPGTELATCVVEKGKPLVVMAK